VEDRKQRNSFGAVYQTVNKVEVPTIIRDYHVHIKHGGQILSP